MSVRSCPIVSDMLVYGICAVNQTKYECSTELTLHCILQQGFEST
jgi:hypothetical protein